MYITTFLAWLARRDIVLASRSWGEYKPLSVAVVTALVSAFTRETPAPPPTSGDDRHLTALCEIAQMLNLPACADPPSVAVPRGVREHLDRLRTVTNGLRWT